MPQYYSKLSKACLRSPLLTPYSTTWWKTTLEKRNTTKSLRAARSAVRTKLILCVTCIGIPHSCRATVSIEINGEWEVCRENGKTRKLHQANAKDHGAISCHLFFVLINDKFKCKFKMTLTTSKSKTTLYFDHIGYTVWDSYISFILCYAPEDASLFQARWYGRGEGGLREMGGGLLNMAKRQDIIRSR